MEQKTTREAIFDLLDEGVDRATIAEDYFPELKKTTIDRYYYMWKSERMPEEEGPEAPVQEAPSTVSVNSIPIGGKLRYNGELFRRVPAAGGLIIAQRLVPHQFSNTFIPRGTIKLDPGTQVEPS